MAMPPKPAKSSDKTKTVYKKDPMTTPPGKPPAKKGKKPMKPPANNGKMNHLKTSPDMGR